MRYFKAQEIAFKPYIIWASVEVFEEGDPLVLQEIEVPDLLYGVCPLKIVDGELVERTIPEMEAFEEEYLVSQRIVSESIKVKLLDNATFTYDGHVFPMNESARVLYQSFDKYRFGTIKRVMSTAGIYDLDVADIDLFLEEYYKVVEGTLMP
ncbi:MAG: hypothetical protein C0525_01300 [Flavobacterium sp.]|uniref:hypothetical protein n=1 Tax=Flavobacterium sp. TaxID=239 RepID=UPI0025C07602|nr:hypothetical protein [Flavobacterium sp.]MBA4133337.1 hypothetical protein [Flavobacterium sp.]